MDPIIVFLANYLFLVLVLLLIFAGYIIKDWREYILAIIIAVILAWDLSAIAGALFYNPRPFVTQGIEPLFPHGVDNGFPSQHTVFAMTLTSVIYFYQRRLAIAAFIITFLIGSGRVWAHVHSWIDIIGGLAIGAIAGYAGVKIARFLLSRFSARRRVERR